MYHLGWDCTTGTIFEIKAFLDAFEKQEKQYDTAFAEETGLSLEEVEELYGKNGPTADRYISAEEAVDLGIVDEIIE
jgi:ATP-dependent protease ClpP protease subunit